MKEKEKWKNQDTMKYKSMWSEGVTEYLERMENGEDSKIHV